MPPRITDLLPFPLLALASLVSPAESACYVAAFGVVGEEDGWVACSGTASSAGGVESCCLRGADCGEDGICHISASANPGNNSWYVAGCTDSSYRDPTCRNDCGKSKIARMISNGHSGMHTYALCSGVHPAIHCIRDR